MGKFDPVGEFLRVTEEAAELRARVAELEEQVAALESREVCTAPHDNVEECGYCQRDRALAALRSAPRPAYHDTFHGKLGPVYADLEYGKWYWGQRRKALGGDRA